MKKFLFLVILVAAQAAPALELTCAEQNTYGGGFSVEEAAGKICGFATPVAKGKSACNGTFPSSEYTITSVKSGSARDTSIGVYHKYREFLAKSDAKGGGTLFLRVYEDTFQTRSGWSFHPADFIGGYALFVPDVRTADESSRIYACSKK